MQSMKVAPLDLKDYLKSLPTEEHREAFAKACDTSLGHMRNTLYDPKKRLAPATCVVAERISGGMVTRRSLRPDDWHRIWPELVTREHPAPADQPAEPAAAQG